MTSIIPPELRPPPSGAHSLLSHAEPIASSSHHTQGANQNGSAVEDDEVQFIDSRPVKRRKTSHPLASGSIDSPTAVNETFFNANQVTTAKYLNVPYSSLLAPATEQDESEAHPTATPLPPLPARPWSISRLQNITIDNGRPGSRVRLNIAVPTIPDSMSEPNHAPILEREKQADYFPWTGKHPEDVLNEAHVKQGFTDRATIPPERELNTGRPTLYNTFKRQAGIDSLSALFSLLLEQKDNESSSGSVSTFRGPPPRVTLTEAKRKSWIADLANPETPLRRLSKTIPQGIRGQMLLDQCLLNSVPLSRAVWFAKCVGANEIRTLKRKGVTLVVAQGAEAKWLKEWTASIEQFIEQNLTQCGQDGWRQRIQYVVQLVSRLYAGNLLDRDHFLDWIVKSTVVTSINLLPFWLMVSGMFRWDLLQYRKRARQFSEALVMKYKTVSDQPGEVLRPLMQKIKEAVRSCFSLRPMSFLMPEKWTECEETLTACIETKSPSTDEVLDAVKRANERILYGDCHRDSLDLSITERALEILDTARTPFQLQSLSESLLTLSLDHNELVSAVCGWAVTKFRAGHARVYLAARLLRRWLRRIPSLDSTVLGLVFQELRPDYVDLVALRHLISELSRSQVFSVSKVLQYLSVRGLPKKNCYSGRDMSSIFEPNDRGIRVQCPSEPSQLLTELCLNDVRTPIQNWRNAMLARAGYDTDNENEVILACQNWIKHFILDTTVIMNEASDFPKFSHIPWTIRTQLSHWVREQAMIEARDPQGMALDTFCRMRYVLESLNDLAILADVLRVVAPAKNESLLATSVDTINFHAEALSAIGALGTLQQLYCHSYLMLRPVKLSIPLLTSSLIDLCGSYPTQSTPISALRQELIKGDRGRAIAACSPFSDGVAESLEQAGETFYDDFEAILQTESNMNEQTMNQLFDVLTNRIVKFHTSHEYHHDVDYLSLFQLFCRLKACRRSHGDLLVKQWLSKLDLGSMKHTGADLLLNLVGTRCIELEVVLELFRVGTYRSAIRADFVELISSMLKLPDHPKCSQGLSYSIKLATKRAILSNAALALDVLGRCRDTPAMAALYDQASIHIVIQDSHTASNSSDPASEAATQKVADVLGQAANSEDPARQALALIQNVNPFALPFCQIRMRQICQAPALRADQATQQEVADVLCDWLEREGSNPEQTATTIQSLLKYIGASIEVKMKMKIEQAFFQCLPKPFSNKSVTQPALPTAEELNSVATSFRRVCLVNSSRTGTPQLGSGGPLIEKLTMYLKCLGAGSAAVGNANAAASPVAMAHPPMAGSGAMTTPIEWTPKFIFTTLGLLSLLLQLICLKRATFGSGMAQPSPVAAKQHQQDQIKLLGLLISIATHPSWQSATHWLESTPSQRRNLVTTTSTIFDVAAILVDDMADESRGFCARLLKDKLRDERVKWLLGSVNTNGSTQCRDAGHGLQMYHEGKGMTTGEFKPKVWEMLEYGGTTGDASLALGLFGVKQV